MKVATATVVMAGLLLAGCAKEVAPAAGTETSMPATTTAEEPGATNGDQHMAELKPPSADSVLYLIYRRDGNGAVSYEIENGATVSYWFGHTFDFKDERYFTGFASKTNDREGEDRNSEYAMEDGRVAISQATLRLGGDAETKEWVLVGTDGYVGEFGGNDRAEAHDGSRAALRHETTDGRMLLAVPTRATHAAEAARGYALFLFDPDSVDSLAFRTWGYLGSIPADGDAGVESLDFDSAVDHGLPHLKVVMQGDTAARTGQGPTTVGTDTLTYRFDADAGRYERDRR